MADEESAPSPAAALLTPDEEAAPDAFGKAWNLLARVVGPGSDRAELASHLHSIENALLAQAAARAYPDKYREMEPPAWRAAPEEGN